MKNERRRHKHSLVIATQVHSPVFDIYSLFLVVFKSYALRHNVKHHILEYCQFAYIVIQYDLFLATIIAQLWLYQQNSLRSMCFFFGEVCICIKSLNYASRRNDGIVVCSHCYALLGFPSFATQTFSCSGFFFGGFCSQNHVLLSGFEVDEKSRSHSNTTYHQCILCRITPKFAIWSECH